MATREFTPLRTPAHSGQAVIQLETHRHPAGLFADQPMLHTALTSRVLKPTARSRRVDLRASSEEGDYEERHYADQNVDNAAHHDPANSSYRCPFRR
jgi:hypothetical protein